MTIISEDGRFEWDSKKNEINVKKHRINFETAMLAFKDPCFYERFDYEHSLLEEQRFIGIGSIYESILLTISYIEKERIRLISVRFSTTNEKVAYNENFKNFNS